MKPWEEFADAMEESQRLVEIERTADCTQRYLYDLIHQHAFKEVREILQHTNALFALPVNGNTAAPSADTTFSAKCHKRPTVRMPVA
jgi:hypothetical protein